MIKDHAIEGTMAYAQRVAILAALGATNNNLSEAARHLRIGRTTIYRLLEEYQITPTTFAGGRSAACRRSIPDEHAPRVRLVDGVWYLEGAKARSPDYR
jgi:DNA-binding IclR family transcriptional regulator